MNRVPFADRLKYAMDLRDVKQYQLSATTGLNKPLINQYLSGKFEPKKQRLRTLANALLVSELWLLGYDVPMDPDFSVFTEHEINLVYSYRNQPNLQPKVDRILGIEAKPLFNPLSPDQDNTVKLVAKGGTQMEGQIEDPAKAASTLRNSSKKKS